MFKKLNKKGFTLAELLIVVAIIGVLVAISIPIFTAQLGKAHLATNQANARAAYAEVSAELLTNKSYTAGTGTYRVSTARLTSSGVNSGTTPGTISTPIQSWTRTTSLTTSKKMGDVTAKGWTVTIDSNGKVTYTPVLS